MNSVNEAELLRAVYDMAGRSKQFVERAHMVLVAGSAGFAMPTFYGSKITLGAGGEVDDFKGILANTGGMRSAVAGSEPGDIEDDFGDVELGPACGLDAEECESCT